MPGAPEPEYVVARRVLLDALTALRAHIDALVIVGAQAVYLHVGEGDLAVAPYTTDGDLAVEPGRLADRPDVAETMTSAGFRPDPLQPGVWTSSSGVSIDLMVPEALAGPGRRGADLGLHGRLAARRARGLEAALVDRSSMTVASLEGSDSRTFDIRVAGPGALLVAKLHKIADRSADGRRRSDKDALDILRLLRGVTTLALAASVRELLMDERSAKVTAEALEHLGRLFGAATAEGSQMAARSAELLENPAEIAASCTALAGDLLTALQA
jgi:hypothetical protein